MDWPMSTTTRMGCGSFASSRRSPMWCPDVIPSAARLSFRASARNPHHPGRGPSTVTLRIPRAVALGMTIVLATAAEAQAPDRDYTVLVASEAVDLITRITFGPGAGPTLVKVEGTTKVGINPVDPDGPHGLGLSPNAQQYYVSTAHGVPYGYLWKFDAKTNEVLGNVELGNFPATLQVTPDNGFIFVVNFNLHGEMVPSNVSVVSTDPFIEVARIETCTMPHGSRLNPAGTKHYSACMMDDMLVEIDTRELAVSRHFMLKKGSEHGESGAPHAHSPAMAGADHGGHGMEAPK